MANKISTGSYDLNKWLYGGYEKDIITTIYGNAGSGKTNFCLTASVSMAKKGNKVIYIDSEGGFSLDRIKQLIGEEDNKENINENILLLKPTSFSEQKQIFASLVSLINENSNIGLIIVDSMTMLYRLEIGNSFEEQDKDIKIKYINRELASQLRTLAEIARKRNIPIIITNQVYFEFIKNREAYMNQEREVKMVGGDLLKYWSKCLIELKNEGGKRSAILRKHRSLAEKEISYVIYNGGIKKKSFF